jgi:hypothetical protein
MYEAKLSVQEESQEFDIPLTLEMRCCERLVAQIFGRGIEFRFSTILKLKSVAEILSCLAATYALFQIAQWIDGAQAMVDA